MTNTGQSDKAAYFGVMIISALVHPRSSFCWTFVTAERCG